MTINKLSPQQREQNAQNSLISSVLFGAAALPLILGFMAPHWFKAHTQTPLYRADCRSAPTVGSPQPDSVPCYQEAAVARLKDHQRKNKITGQDILLTYPGGKTATMPANAKNAVPWTASQIDGPCFVERWHGKITAVIKPGAKILAEQNPELNGGWVPGLLTLFIAVFMLSLWAYLLILWKRGDLSKYRKSLVWS